MEMTILSVTPYERAVCGLDTRLDTYVDRMYNGIMAYRTKADAAVEKAREELAAMFRQREELDIRISKQQRRLAALVTLIDDSEETDQLMELSLGGLTDAIRTALRTAVPRGLTPGEITARLSQLYFPVSEYKNFRASLGTVLKRLITSGEVRKAIHDVQGERDESVYIWVGAIKSRFESRFKDKFGSRYKGRLEPQ